MDGRERREGGWRVGRYPGGGFDGTRAVLADVAAETGAPTLTGFVLDSDAVVVEGCSPRAGYWKACLARETMEAYCDEDEVDFEAEFPAPEAAAVSAAAWAVEADAAPSPEGLIDLFTTEAPDPFAEDLFSDLLDRLGSAPAAARRRRYWWPARRRYRVRLMRHSSRG